MAVQICHRSSCHTSGSEIHQRTDSHSSDIHLNLSRRNIGSEDTPWIHTSQEGCFRNKWLHCRNCTQICEENSPLEITCSHISTPTDTRYLPPHLNHTYGLNFADGSRDYIIPRPDGGVICGGAKSTYFHDRKSWENNWDDSTLLEPARAHFESVLQDNFRGWESSGAAVDYLWTGSKHSGSLSHTSSCVRKICNQLTFFSHWPYS